MLTDLSGIQSDANTVAAQILAIEILDGALGIFPGKILKDTRPTTQYMCTKSKAKKKHTLRRGDRGQCRRRIRYQLHGRSLSNPVKVQWLA